MVDPISSCPRREAHIVQTPLPNYGNNDLEWCLSSYTAVNVEFQQILLCRNCTFNVMSWLSAFPWGARAGEATKKWKEDVAGGQHRQDIEKAKQQEKPKL